MFLYLYPPMQSERIFVTTPPSMEASGKYQLFENRLESANCQWIVYSRVGEKLFFFDFWQFENHFKSLSNGIFEYRLL